MNIKTLLSALLLAVATVSYSQSFKVTYKIDTDYMEEKMRSSISAEDQGESLLIAAIADMKSFQPVLYIKDGEAIYNSKSGMIKDNDRTITYQIASTILGTEDGPIYQNLKTGEALRHQVSFGKEFLIKYPFDSFNWNLVDEYKIINGYETQKAETWLIQSDNPAAKKQHIEAWFTKDIPISSGPLQYGGLPGLIVQLRTTGVLKLVLDEFIKNPKEEINIIKPGKKTPVSLEEYYVEYGKLKKKSPFSSYLSN